MMKTFSDEKKKPRAILTEQQAVEIFGLASSHQDVVFSAAALARRYGVNERTVRDIWKQRTWIHATRPFEGSLQIRSKNRVGRPKGSKDSKPRKPKQGPWSTSDCRRQTLFSISQGVRTPTMPISILTQCSPRAAACPELIDTDCLRQETSTETTFPERQVSSQVPQNLPIDEGPYASDLEFLSENGSIDAELHSWTLARLSWIERAESYLRKWPFRSA
jgi:hypothetical protein